MELFTEVEHCAILRGMSDEIFFIAGSPAAAHLAHTMTGRLVFAPEPWAVKSAIGQFLHFYPAMKNITLVAEEGNVPADEFMELPETTWLDIAADIKTDFPEIKLAVPVGAGTWENYLKKHGKVATMSLFMPSDYRQMESADMKDDDRTLTLPKEAFEPELIKLGMETAQGLSGIEIPQYNYPASLSIICATLAGKICVGSVHPSLFLIRVGGTSTGKTQTDNALRGVVAPFFKTIVKDAKTGQEIVGNELYGPTDFASGPGLVRAVQKHPRCLMVIDEITYVFQSADRKKDALAQGKIKALLELATAAGARKEISYSDGDKNPVLEHAVVNLIGNATPLIFKAFSLEDMDSGLIQRFEFFCYSGKVPYRTKPKPSESANILAKRLHEIRKIQKPEGRFDLVNDTAVDIGLTPEAETRLEAYSRAITDEINATEEHGPQGIISRRYDLAIKLAIIHHASARPIAELFEPVNLQAVEYGILVADVLARWKLDTLARNISAGEFDSICQTFLDGSRLVKKRGGVPTGRAIIERKPALKNIQPVVFEQIIKVLKARKEIEVRETSKGTAYIPLIKAG